MRSAPPTAPLFDLEAPDLARATMVVVFNGVRCTVDRDRLLQLLQREQDWLNAMTHGAAAQAAPLPGAGAGATSEDAVNHASLSGRIKKIYMQTVESKRLRPAHADIIADLIKYFDWRMPNHPNTRLDTQLAEIAGWSGTPAALRTTIAKFLERYSAERRRAATRPAKSMGAP